MTQNATRIAGYMKAPMLERDEEIALVHAYQQRGCPKALDRLLRSHMRLCYATARQFKAYGLDPDDLVQEGALGLMTAARKFDPGEGVRFSTYASYWIYSSITLFIAAHLNVIKGPATQQAKRLFFKLGKTRAAVRHLHPELDGDALDALVADKLGVSVAVLRAHTACRNPASLDAPLGTGENAGTLADLLADERPSAEETLVRKQFLRHLSTVHEALADLSSRDRDMFIRRQLSESPPTLEDLGTEYGISRERVRQLEVKTMKRVTAFVQRAAGLTRAAPRKLNPLYGQPRTPVSAAGDYDL